MTREETINNLNMISIAFVEAETKEQRKIIDDTFNMAIKALEQESILDKVRAEILEEKECAYADFDEYKYMYLGVDDIDDLPDDDFRFGMERAIEIIDKYCEKGD